MVPLKGDSTNSDSYHLLRALIQFRLNWVTKIRWSADSIIQSITNKNALEIHPFLIFTPRIAITFSLTKSDDIAGLNMEYEKNLYTDKREFIPIIKQL